jgi:uncharacterized membrane protein
MRQGPAESGTLAARVIAFVVALASLLLVLGLAIFFVHGAPARPLQTHGFLDVLERAAYGIAHLQARGLVEAGLVVVLLAPLSRLVVGAIQSSRHRDWRFVAIGLLVIALLAGGIVLGTA